MKKPFILFSLILMASLFSGCHDNEKDYYDPEYAKQLSGILNFFDFKSTKDVTLDFTLEEAEAVDYKVYTENPFEIIEESGSVVLKQGLTPIAITPTNESGSYSGILTVPVNLERIFLYAYNPSKILVGEISGSAVTINKEYDIWGTAGNAGTEESSKAGNSRADITGNNFSKKGFLTLNQRGSTRPTWNENENPTNVKQTNGRDYKKNSEEAQKYRALYNIALQLGFKEGVTPDYDLQQDILTDLAVEEGAKVGEVKVTFVGGITSAESLLAYYCYDGSNPPTPEQIVSLPKGIIFFNAAPEQYNNAAKAKIFSGMTVTLKPIKANGSFGDKWEPGTKIGFVIYNNKWDDKPMFSTPFNNEKLSKIGNYYYGCCATIPYQFTDGKTHVLVGMEDWTYDGTSGKTDMNDLIFEVHGVTTKLPPIVTEGEQMAAENKGLLIFEDNWPSMGDYDLNDLVVTYNLKKSYDVKTTINYNTTIPTVAMTYSNPKITDTFVMKHYGANYDNSFAYEINLEDNTVAGGESAIKVTRADRADFDYEIYKKNDNNYIIYVQHYVKTNGFGLGHSELATDFWNNPKATKDITYTVEIPLALKDKNTAPTFPNLETYFNPFILKYAKDRGYDMEIHCIKKAPSHPDAPKAYDDFARRGENNNGRSDLIPNGDPAYKGWYHAKDNFPFAIDMNADSDPDILNFSYPDETQKIGDKFTYFKDWANSLGKTNKDWWKEHQ